MAFILEPCQFPDPCGGIWVGSRNVDVSLHFRNHYSFLRFRLHRERASLRSLRRGREISVGGWHVVIRERGPISTSALSLSNGANGSSGSSERHSRRPGSLRPNDYRPHFARDDLADHLTVKRVISNQTLYKGASSVLRHRNQHPARGLRVGHKYEIDLGHAVFE